MPRYIDAVKVEKWSLQEPRYSDSINDRTDLRDFLRSLPTVSADEVRGKGKWVDKGVRAWSCSCCGTPLNHIRQFASFEKNELPNYCPNCGAKMEVSKDA